MLPTLCWPLPSTAAPKTGWCVLSAPSLYRVLHACPWRHWLVISVHFVLLGLWFQGPWVKGVRQRPRAEGGTEGEEVGTWERTLVPVTSWQLKDGICEKVCLSIFWGQNRNRGWAHCRNPSNHGLDIVSQGPACEGPLPFLGTPYSIFVQL